ncbi:MAG: hypothetical protein H6573_18500 [Lewinellaceae bacterium]|nr:hypothetical protein [Phaeodactylibacter sp.]MCB0614071.1 hypothetical protein [Phaeodactylibacter sp.]MCB9349481.1 hypothetical protein [Lewinellaceae bacterium]
MFIPPSHIKQATERPTSQVALKSSHLYLAAELVSKAFGEDKNVYVIYYPEPRTLMIAPATDETFKTIHKAEQQILKDRNLRGDKTIALHTILIDHQLNNSDRALEYELQPALGILKVNL